MPGNSVKVRGVLITQHGLGDNGETVQIFVAAMKFIDLAKFVQIDRWSPSNPEGYQRPPIERRLKDVAKYVLQEQGIMPTSLLLATRPDDKVKFQFKKIETIAEGIEFGEIVISEGAVLWGVDGQHRFFGLKLAYDAGRAELADYAFPISIMLNVDRYQEMVHFNVINTRQRKMSTDIVDRHLVMRQQKEGLKMLASGKRGEKEYMYATATRVVDLINEEPGPWHHQIAIPGVDGRDEGLVKQHAFVVSLEPVLQDNWVRAQRPLDTHVVKLLCNYWGALKEAWPEAFEAPDDYRLQATVGLYSMHRALPVIIQRCLTERDLSQTKMKELIAETGLSSKFWHKEDGDPLILGTGMASIRALTEYIIDQLPANSTAPFKL